MAKFTLAFGVLLIALGLFAYFVLADQASITAMIPSFFGVLFAILGAVAMKPSLTKHAMHGAAALGVLSLLGTGRSLTQLPALVRGEELARPTAVQVQAIMFVLCLIFVIACVMSFINARKARQASGG